MCFYEYVLFLNLPQWEVLFVVLKKKKKKKDILKITNYKLVQTHF